ncbi:MAG: NUDIX hydrolase, partial [Deltaproteobacteria bacterium]|nr:NUDIX hydrolase [Deltaproteobacteria bacterium]
TNRCHTFLATGCRPSGHTGFDPDEDIETFPAALSSVPGLIADGTIRHSLVVAAFYHLFVTRGGR